MKHFGIRSIDLHRMNQYSQRISEYSSLFPAEILQATPKRFPAQRIPLSEARGASSESSESILLRMRSFEPKMCRTSQIFCFTSCKAWWEHGSATCIQLVARLRVSAFCSFCSTVSLSSHLTIGDNHKPTFALRFLLAWGS